MSLSTQFAFIIVWNYQDATTTPATIAWLLVEETNVVRRLANQSYQVMSLIGFDVIVAAVCTYDTFQKCKEIDSRGIR